MQSVSIVLVAVYVDDVVVTGNDLEEITTLKSFLGDKFKIRDLGKLHYFVGMEVLKVPNSLIFMHIKFVIKSL